MKSKWIEPKKLTVGELVETLKQFPDNAIVNIYFEHKDRDGYIGAYGSKIAFDFYDGKYLDLNSEED